MLKILSGMLIILSFVCLNCDLAPFGEATTTSTTYTFFETVYVGAQTSHKIAAYNIDDASGTLDEIVVSPWSTDGGPWDLKYHNGLNILYSVNYYNGSIQAFSHNPGNGSLNLLQTYTSSYFIKPVDMEIIESKNRAYIASYSENSITISNIDGTGSLQDATVIALFPEITPSSITLTPNQQNLYSTNFGSSSISQFSIDGAGNLTQDATYAATGDPIFMAITAAGNYGYISNATSDASGNSIGHIAIYDIDGLGNLSSSLPVMSFGKLPYHVIIDASDARMYVADKEENAIYVLSINSGSGALTVESMTALTSQPQYLAIDPSGKYLLCAQGGVSFADKLSVFSIDATPGITLIQTRGTYGSPKSLLIR